MRICQSVSRIYQSAQLLGNTSGVRLGSLLIEAPVLFLTEMSTRNDALAYHPSALPSFFVLAAAQWNRINGKSV
jgi:hypothetical protein